MWFRDGGDHYEYIARYVDDILIFSKSPMRIIIDLKKSYPLQGVGIPEYYLGGDFKIKKGRNDSGDTFTICAKTYITNVVKNIERLFDEKLKGFDTPKCAKMITLNLMILNSSVLMIIQDTGC